MLGRLETELDAKDVEMEAATGALLRLAAGESAVGRCGRDGPMEALLCGDLYCPVTLLRFRPYMLEEAGRKADHTRKHAPGVLCFLCSEIHSHLAPTAHSLGNLAASLPPAMHVGLSDVSTCGCSCLG